MPQSHFALVTKLKVSVYADSQAAIDAERVYRAPEYNAITIDEAVVVQNGTQGGNATVDLLLRDEKGNKFVVMITNNLLQTINTVANAGKNLS